MIILDIVQNTPEWLAARAKHFCASEAPAMMGASKYQSRSELLRMKATGITEEIDANTQALFDAGHKAEDAARRLIEELFEPFPKATATDDDGWLLASYDGLNESHTAGWEHKLWNESLAAQVRAEDLPPMYYWQLEHQILVGKLKGVIFTCSDGTPDKCVSMKYRPVPGRADQLLAGWAQFEKDLATYVPPEVIPAAVAAPTLALPAVSIQVEGSIALISNLSAFGEAMNAFIAKIPEKPKTDQQFADCKEACKRLQEAQDMLDAGEAHALGQISSFDDMRRTKDLLFDLARTTRLATEKLVVAEEKRIKEEIVMAGRNALGEHVSGLNKRLGKTLMPLVPERFAEVIKGQKTIASLRNKIDTELASCKIEANAIADRIQVNLNALRDFNEYHFLFADTAQIVLKPNDDFAILVKSRIDEHKAAEAKREEAQRERIRAEEIAKLAREKDAGIERLRRENDAKLAAEQKTATAGQVGLDDSAPPNTQGNTKAHPVTSGKNPLPTAAVPTGIAKLHALIAQALDDFSPGELQSALDAIREIRAARANGRLRNYGF